MAPVTRSMIANLQAKQLTEESIVELPIITRADLVGVVKTPAFVPRVRRSTRIAKHNRQVIVAAAASAGWQAWSWKLWFPKNWKELLRYCEKLEKLARKMEMKSYSKTDDDEPIEVLNDNEDEQIQLPVPVNPDSKSFSDEHMEFLLLYFENFAGANANLARLLGRRWNSCSGNVFQATTAETC